MGIDYQINRVFKDGEISFRLDRIDFDKSIIKSQTLLSGTESECLIKLAEIRENNHGN